MSSDKPENYGLEPNSKTNAAGDGQERHRPLDIAPPSSSEPAPIELEQPSGAENQSASELKTPSVHDLDVCPSCGASMRGSDALVCIRCGFDLKTMRKVETVTGVTAEPTGEAAEREYLVKAGTGNLWLPGALASLSGLILLVGYLAGMRGLFPEIAAAAEANVRSGEITVADRLNGVLRFIVLMGMWTACAVAALEFLAHLLGMKLGDLKLATVRMLAIVVTARLAALINFRHHWLEWSTEALVQAGIFAGLSIVLFKLKPRDAPTLLGAAIVLFMLFWILAHLIVWVAG